MKRKNMLILAVLVFLIAGAIAIPRLLDEGEDDPYIYVTEDDLGKWYFNSTSMEERIDEEEGIPVLDVWVKHDIIVEVNVCARDELLWHIDFDGMRYKVSDAFAYDNEDTLIET